MGIDVGIGKVESEKCRRGSNNNWKKYYKPAKVEDWL